jgi:hypothetical protein
MCQPPSPNFSADVVEDGCPFDWVLFYEAMLPWFVQRSFRELVRLGTFTGEMPSSINSTDYFIIAASMLPPLQQTAHRFATRKSKFRNEAEDAFDFWGGDHDDIFDPCPRTNDVWPLPSRAGMNLLWLCQLQTQLYDRIEWWYVCNLKLVLPACFGLYGRLRYTEHNKTCEPVI